MVEDQVSGLRLAGARLTGDEDTLVTAALGQGRVRRVRHGEDMRRQIATTTATALVHRHVLGVVDRVVAERVDGHQDGADVSVDGAGVEATSKTVDERSFTELWEVAEIGRAVALLAL